VKRSNKKQKYGLILKIISLFMLRIKSFEFNPFQENTYVLYDETNECIIIDPGCADPEEEKQLLSFIDKNNLKVKKLINTHCHIDHVLGNALVKRQFGVNLILHKSETPVLAAVKAYASNYGFFTYQDSEPDEFIAEGDEVRFGNQSLNVLFVPGHSPGHIALYDPVSKVVIGGDVLFLNSIGRTDLPGGDYDTLIASIQEKLFALPDDVTVYCGHGPATTIGYEKKSNPFCALV
jgi:hydroxyacylglutathione hydrolase